MSLGRSSSSTTVPAAQGIPIQSSAYGKPIPIIYGTTRIAGNLIWYGDFKAIPHTSSSSGKGGGDTSSTSYTYTAGFAVGISEGPISGIGNVWSGKDLKTLSDLGLTLKTGTYPQTAWSYLTTNHPTQALGYNGLAYVANGAFDLGSSAALPNLTFEVKGFFSTSVDASPASIIPDFLSTGARYCAGFPSAKLGSFTALSTYCTAAGIALSPAVEGQKAAHQYLAEWLQACNSETFFSEGLLKFVPYADQSVTGGGLTYNPPASTGIYFTDDDYLPGPDIDPVQCIRNTTADAFNLVQVEFLDRTNNYSPNVVDVRDQANIDLFGLRPMQLLQLHCICDKTVATTIAQAVLQRVLYIRNQYKFTAGFTKCLLLEPMDVVYITDSGLGLVNEPVRIVDIEEQGDQFTLTVEEFPYGVATPAAIAPPVTGGAIINYAVAPGNVAAPAFFEAPPGKALSGLSVGIAVTGNSADWGGCEVWASNDGTSYYLMGTVHGGARYGTVGNAITAATLQVPQVTLAGNGGQILGGTASDATNLSTLCLVENEFVAYTTSALVSTNVYNVTLAVRGAYGTVASAHAVGVPFIRVDDSIVYSNAMDLSMIGKTLYFKFLSFNKYGGGKQALSAVAAYTYTVTGVMAQLAPATVSGLATSNSANSIFLSWTVPAGADTLRTEIVRSATNVLSSASFLAAVTGPVGFFVDYIGSGGVTYYYWIRQINKQGFPTSYIGPVSGTTGAINTTPGPNSITNAMLQTDSVQSANIMAGNVIAGKLAANAVQAGNIAANAITAAGGEIADLTVSTLKIGANAVTVPVYAETIVSVTTSMNPSTGLVTNSLQTPVSRTGSGTITSISASITLPAAAPVLMTLTPLSVAALAGTHGSSITEVYYGHSISTAGPQMGMGATTKGWLALSIYVDGTLYKDINYVEQILYPLNGTYYASIAMSLIPYTALITQSGGAPLAAGTHTIDVRFRYQASSYQGTALETLGSRSLSLVAAMR